MNVFCKIFYSLHILSILISSFVEGHGYLKSPRSRNWVAQNDGVTKGGPESDGIPERDSCPHCLNSKLASNLCSQGNAATLYDDWRDINGKPMPWNSQATYNEGDEITVESVLTTNHAGHMDMYICPDGNDSTQECLWNNPLTLIRDDLYGGPTDPNYPERAYYSNSESQFKFTYKLPDGVCGEKVLVQWRYITANSCFPPGYKNTGVGAILLELGWLRASGMGNCGYPYDPTGATGSGKPEQFWNCAEITIKCSYPTVSRAPTPIPQPTPDPTPPPPTSTPTAEIGYCNYGGNDSSREKCDGEVEGGPWCNENKSNCEGSCAGTWCVVSFPTPVTTEWPTYSPVQWPTYSPVQNPTATPITPPTSCVDKAKDKFLFEMKGKKQKQKPVYKNCKWLAKKPQKKIGKICKKNTDSYNGVGPARDICKVLCDTCPTASPIQTPPTGSPTNPTKSPTNAGVGCCTIDFKNCSPTVVGWCSESKDNCEGPCNKWWLPNGAVDGCVARYESCSTDSDCCSPGVCTSDNGGGKRCKAPAGTPSSPVAPPPIATPTSPPPTAPHSGTLSCTENSMSSISAFSYMEDLTYVVSTSPYTLTILAEGGAAGSGGSVVSEGQGYGLLTSAIALASLESSDPNRNNIMNKFHGYFNGWRKMCINSSPSPCQSPQYCTHSGGKAPCLPGWKHKGDLSEVEGTGAAPDGDADAILGMIIATKALEKGQNLPSWYNELRQWTDESITQFLQDNTVLSSSGSHRLTKLGSCWGGWDSNGNNPSYPAPGAFRAMRDFHTSYDGSRNYAMPTFGDNLSIENKWNMLIETTYKFYDTTQCTDTGVVPNWALVKEKNGQKLDKQSGSFSGSGTPQYEFGAEASRTMWRVALDAILYPAEASELSIGFLNPIHKNLYDGFNGFNDWADSTLQTCSHVTSIFNSWRYNGFMFGPVYSTLVVKATSMTTSEQQKRLNAACQRVGNIPNSASYYSKSWHVISMMTLNGDASKVGALLRGEAAPTTPSPTAPPTSVKQPTKSPVSGTVCCSQFFNVCKPNPWCHESESNCKTCNGVFLSNLPLQCTPRFGMCTSNDECCYPSTCDGGQCMYYP